MLLPPSMAWTIIILMFIQGIMCFVTQRQPIVVGPIATGNLPFPLQGIEVDDSERSVYDPGEDPLKSPSFLAEPDEYNRFGNDIDFADKLTLQSLDNEIREEQEIAAKSAMLLKLLENPSLKTLPVVYVENEEAIADVSDSMDNSPIEKRSRYYRRYPWKRQNSRHKTYEADTRYLCVPSREDVFKLLVGIHENRNGNQQKTVNFCNRKRPAKAIFTNIRFLG